MDARKMAISLAIPLLAGAVGSFFTMPSIPVWYASLAKPWFTPPSWLFAPAWALLYVLMGTAFYVVWKKAGSLKKIQNACRLYAAQLVLNAAWSVIFFFFRSPLFAFFDIILLWLAIAATALAFHRVDKNAAYLMVPYLLWVGFAAALNLSIIILN